MRAGGTMGATQWMKESKCSRLWLKHSNWAHLESDWLVVMSTWHPVAVNITTNQSDSRFKVSCEAARKKKGGCRPGNWTGSLMVNGLGKRIPTTVQPNRHCLLCVVAHHVSNWILKPIHRHNTWASLCVYILPLCIRCTLRLLLHSSVFPCH